ncbi:MAG: restriction endonuclease [Mycoplasmatota bacterium]
MFKKIKTAIGILFLIVFITAIFDNFFEGLPSFTIALLCLPTYELFCKKLNKYPSFSRGILIFFLSYPILFIIESFNLSFYYNVIIYFILIIFVAYLIIISSNKNFDYKKKNNIITKVTNKIYGDIKKHLNNIKIKIKKYFKNLTMVIKNNKEEKVIDDKKNLANKIYGDIKNRLNNIKTKIKGCLAKLTIVIKNNKKEKVINNKKNLTNTINDTNIPLQKVTLSSTACSYLYKILEEDNNKKLGSQCLKTVDIIDILEEFYSISKNCKSINEFDSQLTDEFYSNILKKHFVDVDNYIRKNISTNIKGRERISTLKEYIKLVNNITINRTYKEFLEKHSRKFQFYSQVNKYRMDTQTTAYQNRLCNIELTYILDIMALCESFLRLLTIEKNIYSYNSKSDFYTMVSNMTKQIKDINLVNEKIGKFYMGEFGYYSNHYLFKSILFFISEKENQKDYNVKEEHKKLINESSSAQTTEEKMIEYSYYLVDKNSNYNIEIMLINKLYTLLEDKSFKEYSYFLKRIPRYINILERKRKNLKIKKEKERYLKGDFSTEIKEIGSEYLLNNIVTGVQFEEYLVRLFNELNYKVKHNGKSGDQGADLILKYNNYIYAVQAKFYTSKLDNTPVQEIVGSLKYYNANQGVVMTNSTFTKGAENLAKANNVILIDGNDLKKIIAYTFSEVNEDILQKFI